MQEKQKTGPDKTARCQKMQVDVSPREPECPHPDSYCKFRPSCSIWQLIEEEE